MMHDRNHPGHARALEVLSQLRTADPAVISALLQVLQQQDPEESRVARVFGQIGAPAKAAVPALTELLKARDPETRIRAALALWRIDHRADESVPVLAAELKNQAASRAGSASSPLGHFGQPLRTHPTPLCQEAADALAEIGPAAKAALPALTEALRHRHLASNRPSYALALLRIDRPAAKAAVPALIEVLSRKAQAVYLPEQAAPAIRKQAASVLGQMGGEARPAIPTLTEALQDTDAGVRQEAAKALGEIGAQAREVVPSLRKALNDPDEAVRSEATVALKKIGA
jgi:HEAT repeat protein